MQIEKRVNLIAQIAIPGLTILAQILIAFKYPSWGLIVNLCAQPFWIYSGWKAYKQAGQMGLFLTTIVMTIVITFGVINYWFL